MKDHIKKALADKGYSDAQAETQFAILRDKVCGAEPTPAMLAGTTVDDMIAAGVAPAAARAIGVMLAGPKADKAKKYKPGRTYSAREYADHYAADPENADLVSDITRATDRKPWVIASGGKFAAAESARYIQWHMDEDMAPATLMVDGAPIAPVMPGEERKKAVRLYYVDPFNPNALDGFLDVDMVSPRTKASFAGYSDEALSAMQFLWLRELQGEGPLALRQFAEAMRGKEPAAILSGETLAAWNADPKRRPEPKRAKGRIDPFAEPTARIPTAGAVGPTPSFPPLSADALRTAHGAIVSAGAARSRDAFMAGIHPGITASIPMASDAAAQVWNDLHSLASVNLTDGSRPERIYLDNAARLMGPRREAETLRNLLAVVDQGVEPLRVGATPTIHVLGAEHEPAAAEKLRTHLARRIRANELRLTTDRDVLPGQEPAREKARMLREATLVAVLVSADTMAVLDKPAGKRVVPVIVRACMWRSVLGDLTPLPRSGKADSEEAWLEVASGLAAAMNLT